jgi:hypothetical protein
MRGLISEMVLMGLRESEGLSFPSDESVVMVVIVFVYPSAASSRGSVN